MAQANYLCHPLSFHVSDLCQQLQFVILHLSILICHLSFPVQIGQTQAFIIEHMYKTDVTITVDERTNEHPKRM